MKTIGKMSPEELAAFVCQSLRDADITVMLTGGACVSVGTDGQFVSKDFDFIEQGTVPRREIRAVMRRLGFSEDRRYFTHPETDFVVEFPSGPLAVGNEPVREVSERTTASGVLRLLSPTDCVKDRLAAYLHWGDQQALRQALLVARKQRIDLGEVRRWSLAEGAAAKVEEFLAALRAT